MKKSAIVWAVLVGSVLLFARSIQAAIYYQIDQHGVAHFTNAPTEPGYRLFQPGVLPDGTRLTAASIEQLIEAFAAEHDLDPELIRAVIRAESNFNPRAISRKGAQGLMQLMPGTIWRLSVGDAYDPRENIGAGVRYLRELLDLFRGDLTLALAAYNAGEKAVRRYRGVPPYPETRDYVTKVLKWYRQAARESDGKPVIKTAARSPELAPPPPPPPPPAIYKALEASGAILYSNLPPIFRSP
jgi:soluble lytic murein transglycosylase